MTTIQEPVRTLAFDPEKTTKLLEELIEVFQKYSPSVGEMIVASSNLLYSLGSSITPFYDKEVKEKGPSLDELNKLYYSEPNRIDVAFMLQGLTMSTWYEDWEKIQTKDTKGELDNEPNAVRSI